MSFADRSTGWYPNPYGPLPNPSRLVVTPEITVLGDAAEDVGNQLAACQTNSTLKAVAAAAAAFILAYVIYRPR